MLVRHPHLGPLRMNGETNWGPEIRVDGVRQEWLTQADVRRARLKPYHYDERDVREDADPLSRWGWGSIEYLRLPADHPHYATLGLRQDNKRMSDMPAGMQPVKWDQPIEAVHEDGRVVAVTSASADKGNTHYDIYGSPDVFVSRADGWTNSSWRIRNVATPPAEATSYSRRQEHDRGATLSHATAPNGGEVGPEVVDGDLEVLCREMLAMDNSGRDWVLPRDLQRRLRALLPEPIDPDLTLARQICASHAKANGHANEAAEHLAGRWDGGSSNRLVRSTIQHLRALEKEAGR